MRLLKDRCRPVGSLARFCFLRVTLYPFPEIAIASVEKPTRSIMSDRSHSDGPDRQPTRVTLFLFATGIENSYPTIQNGRIRRDQMEECGHYGHWQRDFDLLEELDIRFLRYGPPLHKTFLGQGRYDWEFADLTFAG